MRRNKWLKIVAVIIAIAVIGQALGLWNGTDDAVCKKYEVDGKPVRIIGKVVELRGKF